MFIRKLILCAIAYGCWSFVAVCSFAGQPSAESIACVIRQHDDSRSLDEAVAEFNTDAAKNYVGKIQPKLTADEVAEVALEELDRAHVSDAAKSVLRDIVDNRKLPSNTFFRFYTRYDDGQKMRGVWWVRLVIKTEESGIYSLPVRTLDLYQRPYTQMERIQNSQNGLTLLNRFVSFYDQIPKAIAPTEFPEASKTNLVDEFQQGVKERDLQRLLKLFVWRKTKQGTREFVERELQSLLDQQVVDVSVRASQWDLNTMYHWSAFQHYKPNMPVTGYLDVTFVSPSDPWGEMQTLSFELGLGGQRLWLVNYMNGENSAMPKVAPRLGMQGQVERMPGGHMLTSSIVDNPGELISGHVSNQEIRKRRYEALPGDLSERLKEMFAASGLRPRMQPSDHARDLPDLYRPRADSPGRYQPVDESMTQSFDHGIPHSGEMETISIRYLYQRRLFYIRHRANWSDPYRDHIFGPYTGNPYDHWPEIERKIVQGIRNGDTNTYRNLRRLFNTQDLDLANRGIRIMNKSMFLLGKKTLREKSNLFVDFSRIAKDNAGLLARVDDQPTLESVTRQLADFDQQIESARLKIAAKEYVPVAKWKHQSPKVVPEHLWGKPKNGLRFALVPETTKCQLNKNYTWSGILENVSDKEIRVSRNQFELGPVPTMTHKGWHLSSLHWRGGWLAVDHVHIVLKPGEKLKIGETSMGFAPMPNANGNGQRTSGVVYLEDRVLKSDQPIKVACNYGFGEVNLWRRSDDGSEVIYSPPKGEWSGRVEAADFYITLVK